MKKFSLAFVFWDPKKHVRREISAVLVKSFNESLAQKFKFSIHFFLDPKKHVRREFSEVLVTSSDESLAKKFKFSIHFFWTPKNTWGEKFRLSSVKPLMRVWVKNSSSAFIFLDLKKHVRREISTFLVKSFHESLAQKFKFSIHFFRTPKNTWGEKFLRSSSRALMRV